MEYRADQSGYDGDGDGNNDDDCRDLEVLKAVLEYWAPDQTMPNVRLWIVGGLS